MAAPRNSGRATSPNRDRPASDAPVELAAGTGDDPQIDDSADADDAGIDSADATDFARSLAPRRFDGATEDDISMPVDVDETDMAARREAAFRVQTGGPKRELRDVGLLDALLADGEAPIDLTRDMRADRDIDGDDAFLFNPAETPMPVPAAGDWNWLTAPWAYGVVACMLVLAGYELFMNGPSEWVYRIY